MKIKLPNPKVAIVDTALKFLTSVFTWRTNSVENSEEAHEQKALRYADYAFILLDNLPECDIKKDLLTYRRKYRKHRSRC